MSRVLFEAIIAGDVHAMEAALRQGCSPNARDDSADQTPALIVAIMENQWDGFRSLLRHGADVEVSTAQGTTPLFVAILRTRREMLLELLQRGADPLRRISAFKGWGAIHLAAYYGCASSMEALLAAGADANQLDEWRFPALYWVIFQSQGLAEHPLECVKLLLDHGARVDCPLPGDEDVLSFALHYELDVFVALWEHIPEDQRPDPSRLLSLSPVWDIALFLVEQGAHPDTLMAGDKTLLVKACANTDCWSLIPDLLASGATVSTHPDRVFEELLHEFIRCFEGEAALEAQALALCAQLQSGLSQPLHSLSNAEHLGELLMTLLELECLTHPEPWEQLLDHVCQSLL